MARGIKAVCAEDASLRPHTAVVREVPRRGWFSWLSPAALVPSTAAIGVGLLAAWQAFVLIPSLRWASSPQALSPIALRAAARGEEQALIHPPQPSPVGALPGRQRRRRRRLPLTYELIAPGGAVSYQRADSSPAGRYTPDVLLPTSAIRESGNWVLLLRNQQGAEIARYPFSVQFN